MAGRGGQVSRKKKDHAGKSITSLVDDSEEISCTKNYPKSHNDKHKVNKPILNPQVKEDEGMKKELDDILGLKDGEASSSPFVVAIRDYPYPPNSQILDGIHDYVRDTDLRDYLNAFNSSIGTTNTKIEILCKTFLFTCGEKRGDGLMAPGEDLVESFYSRFYQQKKLTKFTIDLMNV